MLDCFFSFEMCIGKHIASLPTYDKNGDVAGWQEMYALTDLQDEENQ